MRKQEKIIIAIIFVGVLISGSLLFFKYYKKGSTNPKTAASQDASSGVLSAVQSQATDSSLSVSPKPYYSVGATGQQNSANTGKSAVPSATGKTTQENENKNTDTNINSNETKSININSNSNSNSLQPLSYNGNQNINNDTGNSFSFAIIGDTQRFDASDPKGGLAQAVSNIVKSNVSAVVVLGDIASSCDGTDSCQKKYDEWKKIVQPIYDKTKEVQGNHDRTGGDKADQIWQDEFNLPANGPEGYSEFTYSFDLNNSHFVVLDSDKPKENLVNQTQRDWLEKDLAKNEKEHVFVFFHEPAYPVSSKIGESLDANPTDRDALWNILKKYKVTAVFSGHEHIMSRKQIEGIYQFEIGNTDSFDHDSPKPGVAEYAYRGKHYAIVTVKNKDVTVNVYAVEGNLLNSFTLPQ